MENSIKIKGNIYDRLIIVLILLMAFGAIGGAFQPVRLFIAGLIPLTITTFSRDSNLQKKYAYERYFFIFWLVYGFVSLTWIHHLDEGLKELAYLIINFFGLLSLVSLSSLANKPYESIVKAWIILFVLTIPIALYELWFDVHLNVSAHGSDSYSNFGRGVVARRFFASVTFGNLNGYNTMLTFITPFLLGALIKHDGPVKKWNQVLIWLLFLILIYIIIMNSSRGAIGAIIIIFVIFMFYYLRNIQSYIVFLILFLGAGIALYIEFKEIFDFLMLKLELQGLDDEGRSSLIANGYDALINSNLIGIGASDFMPTMSRIYGMTNSSPHNLFLEVFVQYGFVIGVLFLGMFVGIIKRHTKSQSKRNKFIVIAALLSFPLATIIDSAYLLSAPTWLYIASIYVVGDVYFSKKTININSGHENFNSN